MCRFHSAEALLGDTPSIGTPVLATTNITTDLNPATNSANDSTVSIKNIGIEIGLPLVTGEINPYGDVTVPSNSSDTILNGTTSRGNLTVVNPTTGNAALENTGELNGTVTKSSLVTGQDFDTVRAPGVASITAGGYLLPIGIPQ